MMIAYRTPDYFTSFFILNFFSKLIFIYIYFFFIFKEHTNFITWSRLQGKAMQYNNVTCNKATFFAWLLQFGIIAVLEHATIKCILDKIKWRKKFWVCTCYTKCKIIYFILFFCYFITICCIWWWNDLRNIWWKSVFMYVFNKEQKNIMIKYKKNCTLHELLM